MKKYTSKQVGCSPREFALDGSIAIVAGGLGLLGKSITLGLARCGARVVVVDIDENAWLESREIFDLPGLAIEFKRADVSDVASLPSLAGDLDRSYGANILVNCAYPRTDDWGDGVEDATVQNWSTNVEMQMVSSCVLASETAKHMSARNGGSIINIASIYGVVAPDFGVYDGLDMTTPPAYTAIKGGIVAYTRYLAAYWGRRDVRVNAVCPGGVFANQPGSFVEAYEQRTPLGRMANADDIAGPVAFLASDAARYLTGTTLMVDGGWTAQ